MQFLLHGAWDKGMTRKRTGMLYSCNHTYIWIVDTSWTTTLAVVAVLVPCMHCVQGLGMCCMCSRARVVCVQGLGLCCMCSRARAVCVQGLGLCVHACKG